MLNEFLKSLQKHGVKSITLELHPNQSRIRFRGDGELSVAQETILDNLKNLGKEPERTFKPRTYKDNKDDGYDGIKPPMIMGADKAKGESKFALTEVVVNNDEQKVTKVYERTGDDNKTDKLEEVDKILEEVNKDASKKMAEKRADKRVEKRAEKRADKPKSKPKIENYFEEFATLVEEDDGANNDERIIDLVYAMSLSDLHRVNTEWGLGLDTDKPKDRLADDVINCFVEV